jgi:putative ABC transport system ATP-binding protein
MALELSDVTYVYSKGALPVNALRGLSLRFEPGSMTAIVGASGSGKSTLLKLLGALDRPSSGSVSLFGEPLNELDDGARSRVRRDRIGFVFQFFNLLPALSALDNVLLPANLAGRNDTAIRQRASDLLAQVGLAERRGHLPHQLSGGEMQRVAICRALIMDPPVLLADEPTGNLDSVTAGEIVRMLRQSVSEKRTVILVTHDSGLARVADRVITLRDGSVISDEQNVAIRS